MKKTLLLVTIIGFCACNGPGSKRVKSDTCRVSAIIKNPYNHDAIGPATAIRLIKDTIIMDEETERGQHKPDTTYYILISFPVADIKDTTHKTALKKKDGTDSTESHYYPVRPEKILLDFNDRSPVK